MSSTIDSATNGDPATNRDPAMNGDSGAATNGESQRRGGRRGGGLPRPRLTLVNVGTTLIAAAALGLIGLGFSSAVTGDSATTINDPAVEQVSPKPGDLVLRQSEVVIDLAPGYRGVLQIDGQDIPTRDLTAANVTEPGTAVGQILDARFDVGLSKVTFLPQVGATIEAFSPGRHKITAFFWRDATETRADARQVTWFFSVS